MQEFAFYIHPAVLIEDAWVELESQGCQLLYSDEQPEGAKIIFGYMPVNSDTKKLLASCHSVIEINEAALGEIDWQAQWQAHGTDFRDGFVHVDLKKHLNEFSLEHKPEILRLQPGPGFGDLSHATTRLVIKPMPRYIKNKNVIDIGCGSGILALAASALGAKTVVGIDIDKDALVHAQANSLLNSMSKTIAYTEPQNYDPGHDLQDVVILMNMIESEQAQAWNSLPAIHSKAGIAITSGILKEGRNAYLKLCCTWGWTLLQEDEQDGWLGFVFQCK